MPAKQSHYFNIALKEIDVARLDELAAKRELSRAQVLREALRAAHTMTVLGVPTCASGKPCPVPHIHYSPAAAQQFPQPPADRPHTGAA